MLYLDSSALVKLVVTEDETLALRSWLAARPLRARVSSALSCVELVRSVAHHGPAYVARARELLDDAIGLIGLGRATLNTAAYLPPSVLRGLDAIHLGAAVRIGAGLTSFVAYDQRLLQAATDLGLPTESPTEEGA